MSTVAGDVNAFGEDYCAVACVAVLSPGKFPAELVKSSRVSEVALFLHARIGESMHAKLELIGDDRLRIAAGGQ